MQPQEEIHRLVESLSTAPVAEYRREVERALADAQSLADHDEPVVALEILCDNLYEYEVPLSRQQYDVIIRLATSWGVERSSVELLGELLANGRDV